MVVVMLVVGLFGLCLGGVVVVLDLSGGWASGTGIAQHDSIGKEHMSV